MQLEKRNAFIYRKVKQALPRRESERKNHPLAKYCDVLQSVETRMSMLNMTYMRYIENQLVCFIPGKVRLVIIKPERYNRIFWQVLDETKRILDLVVNNKVPPKSSQFLQELRDLSSMAIEHFDEHILPGCREQLEQHTGDFFTLCHCDTQFLTGFRGFIPAFVGNYKFERSFSNPATTTRTRCTVWRVAQTETHRQKS